MVMLTVLVLGCRLAEAAEVRAPIEFPMTRLVGLVTLETDVGEMILDTGASVTVITPETRDRLALGLSRKTVQAEAVGGQISVDIFRDVDVSASGRAWTLPLIVVADFSAVEQYFERPVAGALGCDFFQRNDVELDFVNGIIRVSDAGTAEPPTGADEVDIRWRGGSVWTSAHIDGGRRSRALLDTGATGTSANRGALGRAGTDGTPGASAWMMGADGQKIGQEVRVFGEMLLDHAMRIQGPEIGITDVSTSATANRTRPTVHLGIDLFESRKVLISLSRRRIYVSG